MVRPRAARIGGEGEVLMEDRGTIREEREMWEVEEEDKVKERERGSGSHV
jgi:hypothetical protein